MRTARLRLKSTTPISLATATGPVFALLDAPDVYDRDGDRMRAEALHLPPGHTDVPLYWVHGHRADSGDERVPVGRAKVWREGAQWYMTPAFDEVDELSRTIAAKVAAGTITACSIGYMTQAAAPNGAGPVGKGEDVLSGQLIEVSLVGIGAKAGAVRVKAMKNNRKWKTAEEAQSGLEGMSADVAAMKEQLGKVLELLQGMQGAETKDAEEPPEPAEAEETSVVKWLSQYKPTGSQ